MFRISTYAVLFFLLVSIPSSAAPPLQKKDATGTTAQSIRFPEKTTTPPPVDDGGVTLLDGDQWYVIDSDVECVVKAVPASLVKIVPDTGPIRLKGRFVGGAKSTTREFSGKYIYTVEPVGVGNVILIITPVGLKTESQVEIRQLDVDATAECGKPRPPKPKPVPPVPQPPTPDPNPPTPAPPTPVEPPAPIPGDGLRILIVYDEMKPLNPGHDAIIFGAENRKYIDDVTVVGPDGKKKEWRIFPSKINFADDTLVWKNAMTRPRSSLPWLIVSNGKTGFEGKLPESEADFKAVVERYRK